MTLADWLGPNWDAPRPDPDPDCEQCGGDGVKLFPPDYTRDPEICGCVYWVEPGEGVDDAGDDGAR